MNSNALDYIRLWLRRRRLDAFLVSQPENRQYLSGYTAGDGSATESAGVLLLPVRSAPMLLTDSRYQLQAEAEAAGYEVVVYHHGLLPLLKVVLSSLGIRRFGFEGEYVRYASGVELQKMAGKLAMEALPLKGVVELLRVRKDEEEIDKIRQAVRMNEEVFQEIYRTLAPGQTERQVAHTIEAAMREKGASGPCFETIVAAGPNGARPHAVPSARPIEAGEPVVIDMGLRLAGYCADMTRTVVLGHPADKTVAMLRLVRKAQLAAMAAIKPGISARQADRAGRRVIDQAGLGKNFGHGLGHGVGLAVHEAPSLNRHSRRKLTESMVVTVEPGVYLEGWGGVRLENMVVVRKDGCELLNRDTTFLDL